MRNRLDLHNSDTSPQRHLARTTGRWKDSPKKNTLSELQDELMSVRLREAEAQAELRESRQRILELETQVRDRIGFLIELCVHSTISHRKDKGMLHMSVVEVDPQSV